MSRQYTVNRLPNEQFQFIIDSINNGQTDLEISTAFEKEFGTPLAKRSIDRWRKASGDELAQQYRLLQQQADRVLSNLEGSDTDKYAMVMEMIEDNLINSMLQIASESPSKLMELRIREGERRLKERSLLLKQKSFALKLEASQAALTAANQSYRISLETLSFLFNWLKHHHKPMLAETLLRTLDELRDDLKHHFLKRYPAEIVFDDSPKDADVNDSHH